MLRAKIHSLESDPMAPGGAVSPRAPTSTAVAPLQRQHSFAAHKAISPVTFALNKYWLLVEMLPMVAVCVVIRVIIEQAVADWKGLYSINDVSLVLTGGIFLIGFMLNGIISDYKEAEKLPGEIGGVLGGIEESLVALVPIKTKNNPAYTSAAIRRSMLEVTNVIMQWLGAGSSEDGRDDDAMFDAVAQIANKYTSVMYDTAPPASVHLVQMTTRLRGALTRVAVISHSTYLPAGYALVELFVLLAYVIVVLAKYSSSEVCYCVIVGVTIIYGGMLRLLRDVDNPFEYTPIPEDAVAQGQGGSTEIDLSIFLEYRRNLRARLAADEEAAASAAAADVTIVKVHP